MKGKKKKFTVRDLCVIGLLAALSYVCFTYIQFKISLPGGDATSVHLGNMVPVLGALLFGGMYGALGGAIGMTIGDLFDPMYVVYAPKTLILKLCIGLITGFVAHRLFHLRERQDKKTWTMPAIVASLAGLIFNSIFDPLLGYYYKLLILGKPAADLTLAWNAAACVINAVISTVAAVVLYMALRPALEKSGLLEEYRG